MSPANASAVQVNAQNNQTQQLGITTQGATQQLAITTAGAVDMTSILAPAAIAAQHEADVYGPGGLVSQNQTQYWNSIFANDRWGSGENQVSALSIITGQPAVGVAAQAGQAQSNTASSNALSNILGSLFGSAGKVATAAVAA